MTNKLYEVVSNDYALQVQAITVEIATANQLIANPSIMAVYELAKETKLQMDMQKQAYEVLIGELKKYMGMQEVLISPNGAKIATWHQAQNRVELDKEALKANFADIYAVCCEEKPGNKTFLLK